MFRVMKFHLFFLVLLLFTTLVHTQQIKDALDGVDTSVKDIASQASANVLEICDSLSLCTQQTCSRQPCNPLGKYEINNLNCIAIDQNLDCSGSCQQSVQVSTNQSYLRLPAQVSESNYDLQMSMCAQKPLGTKLQQVWQNGNKDYYGWVFFGTVEGFMYIFPGRDYVDRFRCLEYDPRQRPWYINALAVVKSVHILMDTSGSMANRVTTLSSQSCLDVSQSIVLGLLNTLTNEDRVAVSDLTGASIGSSVNVSLQGITTSGEQAEIIALQDSLAKVKAQNQLTDFKTSLNGSLQFFGSYSKDLKILLIFTNGQFASNLNITELAPAFNRLREMNVVVFFYQTGVGDSNNAISLQTLSTALNTTLEFVKDEDNPLFKIRSYFDYLAWLRFQSVNKSPIWVPLFQDSSGFGNGTSSTYPAFDVSGRLIGVAGIDVIANRFINALGLLAVQDAVSNRTPGPSHLQTFIPPQMKPVSKANCPQSNLFPMCPKSDTSTPMLDFICCGNCSRVTQSHTSSSFWSTGVIAGVSVGGAVGLAIILGGTLFWVYKRWERKPHVSEPPSKKPWDWLTPN